MNTSNVKENIIETTTKLIEQYDGDTKSITARMIAKEAGIGLGLINYHFGSKENLITICVQRIISKTIAGFDMNGEYKTDKERLTACATYVFDFLFEHSAISRISILGDFQNYSSTCNTVRSQQGFMLSLTKDIKDEDKPMIAFILTSAMQIAFLGSETLNKVLGYDFTKSEDRSAYIEKLVSVLFEDNRKE